MVSVAEQLRPRHSDPIDAPGDERAFGEVADVLELQRFGLIVRQAHPEIPPRVEYEFTSRGRSMLDVVRAARRYTEDARGH